MGSFSQTCVVSRLPIEAGDPIRVVLLNHSHYKSGRHMDSWSIRSAPIKGVYDDYGGVENVDETGLAARLALAQFRRDMVNTPWGNNLCHDVPLSETSTLSEIFTGIWESRVLAKSTDSRSLPKVKVPKGIPTWKRVAKALGQAGVKEFTCNRVAYGLVRVRREGFSYQGKAEWLAAVSQALRPHYRVEEKYEHGAKYHGELRDDNKTFDVWLLVTPLDGPMPPVNPHQALRDANLLHRIEERHGERDFRLRPQTVGWAFIREDVWQRLLKLEGKLYSWESVPTVENLFVKGVAALAQAVEEVKSAKECRERQRKQKAEGKETSTGNAELDALVKNILRAERGIEDRIAFMVGRNWVPASPPFVIGLEWAFSHMATLAESGAVTEAQTAEVIRDISEMLVVSDLMGTACIPWGTTYGGPQFGVWDCHAAVTQTFADIAKENLPKPESD